MGYFNQGGNRGSYNNSGDRERGRMFPAVCSECGRDCEVPFRPNGSKPVFCSSCFEAQGNGGRPSRDGGFGGGNRSFEDRTKVRRFEPSGRPIETREEKDNRNLIQLKEEVSKLTAKIDQLVDLLTPKTEEKPKKSKKKVEEAAEV